MPWKSSNTYNRKCALFIFSCLIHELPSLLSPPPKKNHAKIKLPAHVQNNKNTSTKISSFHNARAKEGETKLREGIYEYYLLKDFHCASCPNIEQSGLRWSQHNNENNIPRVAFLYAQV